MEDDRGETQHRGPAASGGSGDGDSVGSRVMRVEQEDEDVGGSRTERLSCSERNAEWLSKIGDIQQAGYVFVLKEDGATRSGLRLAGVSANVKTSDWWRHDRAAEDLLGSDISTVFDEECAESVSALVRRHKASQGPCAHHSENLASVDFCPFPESSHESLTCRIVPSNPAVFLLEVELTHGPLRARQESVPGLTHVAQVMRCFTPGATPEKLTSAVCDSLMRSLPGYDRVMVYRFAADKTGEVIHEAIRPGCEITSSYLNLRFPAGDLPDPARKLLVLNRIRFITDTSMEGSPLTLNLEFEEGDKIDLSMSFFRASPLCHLRYLRNMGVKASLAAAITVDNELWGMFSFHCYTRVVVPTVEERTLVEMAASVTGMTLARYGREVATTNCLSLTNILGNLSKHTRIQDFLSAEYKALLSLLEVDTIVLCEQLRAITVYGDSELALNLVECKDMLQDDRSGKTLAYTSEGARGVAYFSVRSFLIAFVRGSVAHRIAWAGEPDPPLVDHDSGHPRTSFERYVSLASAQYPPWSVRTKDLLGITRHGIAAHLYAEALPADLEEIFAHVSHELRTPFHGVMGSLEMLDEGLYTMGVEERRSVIRSAIACGNCMLTTLSDILDIAKDRNNSELSYSKFAVSSPVVRTMAAMSQFGAQKSLQLFTKIDPATGAMTVVGDERRIKHIVQNLVNNAIKFTPIGGTVWISLLAFENLKDVQAWWSEQAARFESHCWKGVKQEAEGTGVSMLPEEGEDHGEKRWFVYSVEDTGVGVSKGDLLLLTSAYRQLSHGASKAYAGTGLGLHISNIHIHTMSGFLGIASTSCEKGEGKSGLGTIFACILPLCLAMDGPNEAEEDAAVLGEREADPTRSGLLSRKVTFVVADDHPVNIKLLRHKISKAFHEASQVQVVSATDGEMALDRWSAARTAADADGSILGGVFMDFHMPDVDGVESTAKIRSLEAERSWPRTPISGCTADPTDRTKRMFDQAGGDDVLYKPWRPGQVEIMCRRMVARALKAETDGEEEAGSLGRRQRHRAGRGGHRHG